MNALNGQRVLVLGLGESGRAMAHWCAHAGARLRIADTRREPPGLAELTPLAGEGCHVGAFSDSLLEGIDCVAVSPGVAWDTPLLQTARARGLRVVGEMALLADALAARAASTGERPHVIAITGTNGKTTATALTAALCQAAGLDAVAAGNISPAALAVALEREQAQQAWPQCWVLELSSFQIESMGALQPDVAVVLNVTDDHLDRHGSMAAYAAIKQQVLLAARIAVVNRDDPLVAKMAAADGSSVSFGSDAPPREQDWGLQEYGGRTWLCRGSARIVAQDVLQLAGRHNALNVQAALALVAALGLPLEQVLPRLQRFAGLPHRMVEVARRADDVVFFNDSKGTNVGATVAALQGLGRPAVLIAGGDGKGQDFAPLAQSVAQFARAVVLFGRDAEIIAAALQPVVASGAITLARARDLDDAVNQAAALAQPGDAVLLSPACASLDMFRSYAQRGELFVAAVQRLLQEGTV